MRKGSSPVSGTGAPIAPLKSKMPPEKLQEIIALRELGGSQEAFKRMKEIDEEVAKAQEQLQQLKDVNENITLIKAQIESAKEQGDDQRVEELEDDLEFEKEKRKEMKEKFGTPKKRMEELLDEKDEMLARQRRQFPVLQMTESQIESAIENQVRDPSEAANLKAELRNLMEMRKKRAGEIRDETPSLQQERLQQLKDVNENINSIKAQIESAKEQGDDLRVKELKDELKLKNEKREEMKDKFGKPENQMEEKAIEKDPQLAQINMELRQKFQRFAQETKRETMQPGRSPSFADDIGKAQEPAERTIRATEGPEEMKTATIGGKRVELKPLLEERKREAEAKERGRQAKEEDVRPLPFDVVKQAEGNGSDKNGSEGDANGS